MRAMAKRNYAERDRLHGKGLPANLGPDVLARIALKMAGKTPTPQRKYATATQVMAEGYEPLGDGRYRKAHQVWALRPAEDGEGYVLVRQQEELASDLRTAQTDAADLYDAHELMHDREPQHGGGQMTDDMEALINQGEPEADDPATDADTEAPPFEVGDKVAAVRRGQLADAMIVLINPSEQLADLLFDTDGGTERDVPMDQLMEPCDGHDEGDVEVELVSLLGGGGGSSPF